MREKAFDLTEKHCKACEGGEKPLGKKQVAALLKDVPKWAVKKGELTRTFPFKDYYQTMAFVNATAWISHRENHHPDLEVGYNKCVMCYSTHAIGGLSENDFICAAKVDALEHV